jgi:phosphoglycerate-specific signal transduction histidine kinase
MFMGLLLGFLLPTILFLIVIVVAELMNSMQQSQIEEMLYPIFEDEGDNI